MTIVSNDPAWWPAINAYRVFSRFAVASFVGVTYDWSEYESIKGLLISYKYFQHLHLDKRYVNVITETAILLRNGLLVELIWRKRWSLMTIMYIGVRYLGILYAVLNMLISVTTVSLTDTVSYIMYAGWVCIVFVIFTMLWVIIINRLHAMYQRSRKILIFLIVTFLAATVFNGVAVILATMHTSGEEFILSGTHQCSFVQPKDIALLLPLTWIFVTVWEVFAMYPAVWIAVKQFREVRRDSTGGIIGDCFTVLMKTHLLYFTSFVVVSCFQFIDSFNLTYLCIRSRFIISTG
ncbi:hypothetical protein BDR07DRAFT_640696 [Suillus spraguei]|nr:hypothetical protein BDR07DRAFT_640696 [Suillus spraguei]